MKHNTSEELLINEEIVSLQREFLESWIFGLPFILLLWVIYYKYYKDSPAKNLLIVVLLFVSLAIPKLIKYYFM